PPLTRALQISTLFPYTTLFRSPEDELAQARINDTLQRNFQGYSTHADCDLIGLGVSSIGKVGDTYSQNVKELSQYYAYLNKDQRSEEHTSELQSRFDLVCRLLL